MFDERQHTTTASSSTAVSIREPPPWISFGTLARSRGGRTTGALLCDLVQRLGIEPSTGRGLKYLSTGEIRKVLLCRELLREPALLIFDEPYEGYDPRRARSRNRTPGCGFALPDAAHTQTNCPRTCS